MGWEDGVAGAVAGGLIAGYGANQTNQANLEIAQMNNAWAAEQYAKRYQVQVEDLKKAGLNPMLAYGQSPGSAPSPQQVVLQNPYSAAVNAFNETKSAAGRYETDVAGAGHHRSSASAADAMVKQIDATVDKIKEETKNVPDQGKQIRQTIQKLADESALLAEKGLTEHVIRDQLKATVRKLHSEADLLGFDISAAVKFDNFGRESGQYKAIIDLIKTIFKGR